MKANGSCGRDSPFSSLAYRPQTISRMRRRAWRTLLLSLIHICMGFAINAARSIPDLYCLCSHCGILPKNFYKPRIATEKSFCNSKSVHSRSKQCLRIYKDHFCVAKCLLGNPKPLNCIRRMQAARFTKRSFSTPQECAAITVP